MLAPKLYLDTETCGRHGFAVLIQYAAENGPIVLFEPWRRPAGETIALLEWIATHTIVGFNLTFDWFHIAKLYTTFRLLPPSWIPADHIDLVASREPDAQNGPCIKPAGALDLMLHSRKGPYQSLMARKPIYIRKVPTLLAQRLADKLEATIELDGIYFARETNQELGRWRVEDRKRKDGTPDPDFKNVVLKFKPSGALKVLAEHALGMKPKALFTDIEIDKNFRPIEFGFAPTALAVSTPQRNWCAEIKTGKGKRKGYAWPGVILNHIGHWAANERAREYARDDIVYTRALDKHFGCPQPSDDDSVLACMVGATRWRGYAIDVSGIEGLLAKADAVIGASPINTNKPTEVRRYLCEVMDDTESLILRDTTSKDKLEEIEKQIDDIWRIAEPEECVKCNGSGDLVVQPRCKESIVCQRCAGKGHLEPGPHPAVARAKQILEIKRAMKERELYHKLLRAGKLHADFVIIGAKSSRMSGAGGLNAQAVKRAPVVRSQFPLAWPGYVLSGGDFDAFEVSIMAAIYNDPELNAALVSDKKIHALFGESLYGVTYDQVMDSDGTDFDMYDRAKKGVFLDAFGGEAKRLGKVLNLPEEIAAQGQRAWNKRFVSMGRERAATAERFGCMKQPGGIGTEILWCEPAEFAVTLLDFPRYFTLENRIVRALFDLAANVPQSWAELQLRVMRDVKRGRSQTAGGAVSSALYGAAFGIAAQNVRAAGNHKIQGTGAGICKAVQRAIWDLQPDGVSPFVVAPMNIHDELMCPCLPAFVDSVSRIVRGRVEHFRQVVPLLGMTWFRKLGSWAGKKGKGAEGKVSISPPKPEPAA